MAGRRGRLSFTQKTAVGLVATVVLAAAVLAALIYALHLVSSTRARVRFEHERDVLTVHAMRAAADREAAAAFDFLLTGDDRQIFTMYSARGELEQGLTALATRLVQPAGEVLLARVAEVSRQHHAIVDGAVEWPDAGRGTGREDLLRAGLTRLTQALDVLSRYVELELATATERSLAAADRTGAIVALGGCAILVLAGALAWLFARTMTRLYGEAQAAAGALANERDVIASLLKSQRFLAEAGARLAESLELSTTVERVAALPVPRIADGCELVLLDQEGGIGPSFIAHDDPNVAERAREMRRLFPLRLGTEHGPGRVLFTSQAELIPCTDDETWRNVVQSDDHTRMLSSLGIRSYLGVPLRARGRLLGMMSLVITRSPRQFGARDLELAEDLASRAALALDNAALYRRAQETIAFTGAAAHEVRSPLSALQLQAELLARRAEREVVDRQALLQTISRIQHQGERLSRLVASLLDVSQINAGRLRIEPEPGVELGTIVRDVAARLQPEFMHAGSALEVHAPAPVTGRWDRTRLEQVVTNLLTNAVKYGRGAPVEVRVEVDERRARLAVRDHGIGIAAEDQARIFDSYERAVASGGFKGHGLGLWITRRMVRAMGGDVRVSSRPGQGALFVVDVPREPPVDTGSRSLAVLPLAGVVR